MNRSDRPVDARLGLEWTVNLLGGGGNPSAWFDAAGERDSHERRGDAHGESRFAMGQHLHRVLSVWDQRNHWIGMSIESSSSEPADLWWAPVETVSNSEAGFERVYQGAG